MLKKDIEKMIRERLQPTSFKQFNRELSHNSDRGIALICGALIEQDLALLLKSFLVKANNIDKLLFKPNQPLGNFEAKLQMAFYLGLISENERLNLAYIQRIRNKFAHNFEEISFKSDNIKHVCENFHLPKNSYMPPILTSILPFEKKYVDLNPVGKNKPAKDNFIYTFQHLHLTFLRRINTDTTEHREEYTLVETANELSLFILNKLKDYKKQYHLEPENNEFEEESIDKFIEWEEKLYKIIQNSLE